MAKGIVRIKGGSFIDFVSDIPNIEVEVWDEDLKEIDSRYEQYEGKKEKLYKELKVSKYNYLVTVKGTFTRDIQIASNEYITKLQYGDMVDDSLSWGDFDDGEVVIGVYKGANKKEAIVEAAISFTIDESALKAYPLA